MEVVSTFTLRYVCQTEWRGHMYSVPYLSYLCLTQCFSSIRAYIRGMCGIYIAGAEVVSLSQGDRELPNAIHDPCIAAITLVQTKTYKMILLKK